jgi:hypothetical protein
MICGILGLLLSIFLLRGPRATERTVYRDREPPQY